MIQDDVNLQNHYSDYFEINTDKRASVHEWSSSRFVSDSETDIHYCLDAFLTHWIGGA